MENMEHFLEVYGNLPRAGPGGNEHTQRAFGMVRGLSDSPRFLDIGCGPGMQTLELIRLCPACRMTALDLLPEMLQRLERAAAEEGVLAGMELVQMDMNEMSFEPGTFDLVWSEGAVYIMGFDNGIRKVRNFIRPGGCLAVSEAVWLKPDPPAEVLRFWKEYPEIDTVEQKLRVIAGAGYELLGHFILPPEAWTEYYYDPMKKRIAELEPVWKDVPKGLAVLAEAREEIDVFERFHDYYSYCFFVMKKPM